MALERIDPISLEDCYAVDHLLRYALAAPLSKGKRILDAASGMGFGSVMLLHQDAAEVVGVDNSAEAVELCRARWKHDKLRFQQLDLEQLAENDLGRFGLITSFETLEHVKDPGRVVEQFEAAMEPDGILFGSVPGQTDRLEDNAFHLHHFNAGSLEQLLRAHFSEVRIFRQEFAVKSSLRQLEGTRPADSLHWKEEASLEIDFGKAGEAEDSLVFLAGNNPLPELDLSRCASSRTAWLRIRRDYLQALADLEAFSGKYRELFLEHGDLKVKFTNMLGWGQWHYEKLHGEPPAESELERLAQFSSKREADLKQQVEELQARNLSLKAALAQAQDQLGSADQDLTSAFEDGARSINRSD